ncbi:hypothetical protein VTL71DRAFT_4595 [Oculimacula yallundae]|uniref:Uncharacterized protein n=1 Tax=Oculimacula yallundae TaxID=86028 RepID=A0ABR4C3K7_9HELO
MLVRYFTWITAVATAVSAAANSKACAADNCLRAVRATALPMRPGSASADCSSYFRATVTPAASTVTMTINFSETLIVTQKTTFTSVVTVQPEAGLPLKEKRQRTVIPSEIPTYASACSGSVRYSSACSCIGVTQATITASRPTTTITISETSTSTATTKISTGTTTTSTAAVGTCSATTFTPGSLPLAIGQAIRTSDVAPAVINYFSTVYSFGMNGNNVGDVAHAEINPTSPAVDNIVYYQAPATAMAPTRGCLNFGYFYHVPSGLCVTAQSTASTQPAYSNGQLSLQPCNTCTALPINSQIFCDNAFTVGAYTPFHCMLFYGSVPPPSLFYGTLYGPGPDRRDAKLAPDAGDCIWIKFP